VPGTGTGKRTRTRTRTPASPDREPLFITAAFEDVELLQCRPFLESGVPHGFTLRTAAFGDRENDETDRSILARALGFSRVAFMRQVHGNDVAALDHDGGDDAERQAPTCDAVLTDRPGLGLTVLTADCVPLLLWSSKPSVVAAIHAGWRGTLALVVSRAVRSLETRYGVRPEEVRAAIGPAIRVCCFEVGDEVVAAFGGKGRELDRISRPGPRGRRHLDLVEDNRSQLTEAGVSAKSIYDSGRCSYCERERFYSYRREGKGVGRTMGVIGVPFDDTPSKSS
jgi:purine-nucleoside/S-methyl-5'-thioadenosine phosphorylase / adenosine deaminase